MVQPYSPLTLVLSELLQRGFAAPPTKRQLDQLEEAVSSHGLEGEKAPPWMFEFFARILSRRLTPRTERYEVPTGYPFGESGLSNVLLDIDRAIHWLGLDDSGEEVVWPLPKLGVRVCIIREWNGKDCYGVVIEPM
jgi:hypothetical protein